jgi:hypothetical protein
MFVTFFFFCLLLKVYFIQIRFTAIVVCSRAAQYLTQKEIGTIEKKNLQCIRKKTSFYSIDLGLKVHLLPEKLLQTIESLLNDPQERIRTAAAIALITLHRFSPQVFIS